MTLSCGWGETECAADVSFTIDSKGVLEGTATCGFDGGGGGNGYPDLEGVLAGTEKYGLISLVWTLQSSWGDGDADGGGEYADGLVEGEVGFEAEYVDFAGIFRAERQ